MKIDLYYITPVTLLSGDIRFLRTFAGVRLGEGSVVVDNGNLGLRVNSRLEHLFLGFENN